MEFWVVLFIVIVILGAVAGGKSFGGTILNGIGCLVVIIVGVIILLALNSGSAP